MTRQWSPGEIIADRDTIEFLMHPERWSVVASKPKWGQRGRGRKRRMRLAARRKQREIAALFTKVRALADGAILLPNSPQTASHPHLSLQHLRYPQQATEP